MKRKGQLGLNDAPAIVLIVGLTFLLMATLAYVGSKYGAAMPADESATVVNETLTTVTEAGEYVTGITACNFEDFAVVRAINSTDGIAIPSTNYTVGSDGKVSFTKGHLFNNTNWKVTYTYSYTGTSCNVTDAFQTEIENNTSIAGIVLTISLIGIVLSVLIAVFALARNRM